LQRRCASPLNRQVAIRNAKIQHHEWLLGDDMSEPDTPRLPPQTEILVRDLVETQVARRVDGYGSALKYVAAAVAALFAVFGLKTCSDIESGTKAVYDEQLKKRLDSADASSEIAQYRNRLAALYRRGLIDAAILRTHRVDRHFRGDRFRELQVPPEDIQALLKLAQASDTTDGDFSDALAVLQDAAELSQASQSAEIPSALNDAVGNSPSANALRPARRAAAIRVLAKLRYREAARNIRGILSDATASDDLRLAATEYATRVRDTEAADALTRLMSSDNVDISAQARVALAVIQPDHTAVKEWVATLSDKSSISEVASALRTAAEISRAAEDARRVRLPGLDETTTKWESDSAKLFSALLTAACTSQFGLRRWEVGDDDSESDDTLPAAVPANVLLTRAISGGDGGGYGVSSRVISGSLARSELSKLLEPALRTPASVRVLRFFGATAEPEHLSDVTANVAEGGVVKLADGRSLDKKVTSEVVFLATPGDESKKIVVYWRDLAGQSQSAVLLGVEGNVRPELRVHVE
jgi:hypothetical protein